MYLQNTRYRNKLPFPPAFWTESHSCQYQLGISCHFSRVQSKQHQNASNTPTVFWRKMAWGLIWICRQQQFNIHLLPPFLSSNEHIQFDTYVRKIQLMHYTEHTATTSATQCCKANAASHWNLWYTKKQWRYLSRRGRFYACALQWPVNTMESRILKSNRRENLSGTPD